MTFGPDLTACAALVQRADPDRFLSAMAAPVAARRVLFPIYAMNAEIARAPWVTAEAMIAEMRLQWWRDALGEIAAGGRVRRHEVTTPLAQVLSADLAAMLDQLVAVRRWDIYRDPFEDAAHFGRYIDRTSGSLMWAAARTLGAADETVVRDFGYASGVANWLVAVPRLLAQRRVPLLDATPGGVRALAGDAMARLVRARAARARVSRVAAPALLAGWQAGAILSRAIEHPELVGAGGLEPGPLRKRLGLMARAAARRW